MESLLPYVGVVAIILIAIRTLRPRRKLSFDQAVLKAKSAPFVWVEEWKLPSYALDRFPADSKRVDNGEMSIIYFKFRSEGKNYEHIDMNQRGVGQGGLNISFVDGAPVRWGRFGDTLNLPGITPSDAQKARTILADVKKALKI